MSNNKIIDVNGNVYANSLIVDNGSSITGNISISSISEANVIVLSDSGNANVVNLFASSSVQASKLISTVITGESPLVITSTTRVANLNVANAAYADVSGSSASSSTAATVTSNAQPNITSLGTLTSLGVNGTVTAVSVTANSGVFTGNGIGLTSITGANVTGTVANATYATSAGSAASATTSGTVTANSQSNITSLGTLTSLGVNGTVTAVAFTSNTGVFTGNGSGLTEITGANVTGTVANATFATSSNTSETVTGNTQSNITSVGILSSLAVSGQANLTAIYVGGSVGNSQQVLTSDGTNATWGYTGFSSKGQQEITTTGTLTSAVFGAHCIVSVGDITITLPSSSTIRSGEAVTLKNISAANVNIAFENAGDGATVLLPNQSAMWLADGGASTFWRQFFLSTNA